jgi:carbon-monoxide dehydrogenase large subunit
MNQMSDNLSADRFLVGAGGYLDDLEVPDVLTASFVRSPLAHGEVVGLETTEAKTRPGVTAVFTADDLELPDIPGDLRTEDVPALMSRPPLARGFVRYAGEPIALVVAEDRLSAVDAAALVFVDVEPLPSVTDVRKAAEGEVLVFPKAGTNVAVERRTRVVGSVEDWPVSAELDLFLPRLAPVPIEPLGMIAIPDGDGQLSIWCSHQMPHRLRKELALCLEMAEEQIRIRVPDVGGAFGQKGQLNAEYVVVAAAARKLGRPVKWTQSRRENLAVGTHGRGVRTHIRMLGATDGTIKSLEVTSLADAGAYPHSSAFVPLSTHLMSTGPYRFESVDLTTTVLTTTTTPTGPYRGAGRPEAAYALERCIEEFARKAGIDAAEVRRKNLVRAENMPYETPTGAVYDSGDYGQALELLLSRMDYWKLREEQSRRRETGESPIGIGIAVFLDRTGGSSLTIGEYGSTEVTVNGTVRVRTGSTDSGQGHWPIWRRLAGEALDVAAESVEVITGDTGRVPEGTGTFGSRSSQSGASSVFRTAKEVRRQALELAARKLEIDTADLVSDGRGGFVVRGTPDISISLSELAESALEAGTPLFSEEYFVPGAHTFPHAAHGAVVSVDVDTGAVVVDRYVAVDDCGRILDPAGVQGQVQGSVVQGIGAALYEGVFTDEEGQLLTGSLAAYSLPHATDIPPIATAHTETPAPSNPLGAKGVGESGTIGAPAVIVNAVVDALSPWEIKDVPLPTNPMNVWSALHASSRDTLGGSRSSP